MILIILSNKKNARHDTMAGVSFLLFLTPLVEREEEEIGGYPFAGNAWGLARVGAGTVAHRTVTFDLADAGATAVADGAVALNLTAARTAAVVDGLRHSARRKHRD